MSVDSGRRSLEMYTKQSPNKNVLEPVKAQFDYSKLPVLTTQRPWDGRQAKKQKKPRPISNTGTYRLSQNISTMST